MIRMLRLDERLVHGQVATKMLVSLDIDTLVVVDDNTAASEIASKAIMMAVLGSGKGDKIKTSIKTTEVAVRLLNDPRCEPKKILIVCRYLDTLLAIVRGVPGIHELNVGNYGSIIEGSADRENIVSSLFLNEQEKEIFREILATDIDVYVQKTPDGPKATKEELIKLIG